MNSNAKTTPRDVFLDLRLLARQRRHAQIGLAFARSNGAHIASYDDIRAFVPASADHLGNALVRLFETAGMTEIKEHRQLETLLFRTQKGWLDAVLLGGPVALAVKRFSDSDWKEVCQEFLSSVAHHKQSDRSYAIPGEFVTVTGVRAPI